MNVLVASAENDSLSVTQCLFCLGTALNLEELTPSSTPNTSNQLVSNSSTGV